VAARNADSSDLIDQANGTQSLIHISWLLLLLHAHVLLAVASATELLLSRFDWESLRSTPESWVWVNHLHVAGRHLHLVIHLAHSRLPWHCHAAGIVVSIPLSILHLLLHLLLLAAFEKRVFISVGLSHACNENGWVVIR